MSFDALSRSFNLSRYLNFPIRLWILNSSARPPERMGMWELVPTIFLLKQKANIAGITKNPAAWFFFIHFSNSNSNISLYTFKLSWIEIWLLSYLWNHVLSFKTQRILLFLCKFQGLMDSAIPFPGDFCYCFSNFLIKR